MKEYQILIQTLDLLMDPVEIFRTEFLESSNKFLLESSVIKPEFSRFTFMGDAYGKLGEVINYHMPSKTVTVTNQTGLRKVSVPNIFDYLKTQLAEKNTPCHNALPFGFNLGYVGFLGYELKAETIGSRLHDATTDDAVFIFATRMIVCDHLEKKTYLLYLLEPNANVDTANAWFEAVTYRIQIQSTNSANKMTLTPKKMSIAEVEQWIATHARIRHERNSYLQKIGQSLEEIRNGETYEVCLTNNIEFKFNYSPFELYCLTRKLSPAPHSAFFSVGDLHLVSASPERFLSVNNQGLVEAKPIKGTRPRGNTIIKDANYIEELQHNEKDRAENLMIVDLLRNDLGQVCVIGSVKVPKIFAVETYSHVHQLVSTIQGQLKPDVATIDVVRAVFPGGSMTGAPKKRTMEIIDRLEDGPREAYSGALGWFGLGGACDLSIIIRSLLINAGQAKLGVGGAITALSNPEDEFIETIVKARGMIEAVEALRNNSRNSNEQVQNKNVVVIGATGSIGKLLTKKFVLEFDNVIGIDLQIPDDISELKNIKWLIDDITSPNFTSIEALANADIVVFALAEQVIIKLFPKILSYINPNCLIVETLTIKTNFAQLLENYQIAQMIVGINPMFSGDLDPKNRSVVSVVHRNGLLVDEFYLLLRKWQINIYTMTAAEHDRTMSIVQSQVHILVLAFGMIINNSNMDIANLVKIAPPPFQLILLQLARMTQNHPDVYWEIQAKNPYSAELRQHLKTVLTHLENMIAKGDQQSFHEMLSVFKTKIIKQIPFFSEACPKVFNYMNLLQEKFNIKHNPNSSLSEFRQQIDDIDDKIIDLLGRRFAIIHQVAKQKHADNISVMQPSRVNEVKSRCKIRAQHNNLREPFVDSLFQAIIDEACWVENNYLEVF